MQKYRKPGTNLVAVLVSSGYGGGWSTWVHGDSDQVQAMLFDARLVRYFLGEDVRDLGEVMTEVFGDDKDQWPFTGGQGGVEVEWVPEGTLFKVQEYDGFESLLFSRDMVWNVA